MPVEACDQRIATLQVVKEERITAPVEAVFEALLEEMGQRYVGPTGTSLHLKIEPWPGGRWFRDLGNDSGHFWGQVQSIKAPELLEIYGPLFMSAPVISQVQFRLTAETDHVRVKLVHRAFGPMPDAFSDGKHLDERWGAILQATRLSAENRNDL